VPSCVSGETGDVKRHEVKSKVLSVNYLSLVSDIGNQAQHAKQTQANL
jgi:hypothetical protein